MRELIESMIFDYLPVSQINEVALVTVDEAQESNNRVIGIKTPGWTLYDTYEDATGNTRRKVETLVAMKSTS